MTITKKDLADRLIGYLQHQQTLAELVDWAERALMEADLEEPEMLREALARLGLADVRAFVMGQEIVTRAQDPIGRDSIQYNRR